MAKTTKTQVAASAAMGVIADGGHLRITSDAMGHADYFIVAPDGSRDVLPRRVAYLIDLSRLRLDVSASTRSVQVWMAKAK